MKAKVLAGIHFPAQGEVSLLLSQTASNVHPLRVDESIAALTEPRLAKEAGRSQQCAAIPLVPLRTNPRRS